MRRVAVVTCLNGPNQGMYSVDLAAPHFFRAMDWEPDLFCAHAPPPRYGRWLFQRTGIRMGTARDHANGGLRKRLLSDAEELKDYDVVCYWGDFTTNPCFLDHSFLRCERITGIDPRRDPPQDRWERLFGHRAQHRRKISLGQNFQHRALLDDPERRDLFAKNLETMKAVLPRDSVSTEHVQQAGPSAGMTVRTMLDCAFFVPTTANSPSRSSEFAYFFGRSGIEALEKSIGALEARSGLKGVHLDTWLSSRPWRLTADFAASIAAIRQARFVLTDTYHLAINALREGVMPVVVSRRVEEQTGTLGDYKKKTLLNDLGLGDLLVEVDDAEDARALRDRVLEIAERHSDGSVRDVIEALPDRAKSDLASVRQLVDAW